MKRSIAGAGLLWCVLAGWAMAEGPVNLRPFGAVCAVSFVYLDDEFDDFAYHLDDVLLARMQLFGIPRSDIDCESATPTLDHRVLRLTYNASGFTLTNGDVSYYMRMMGEVAVPGFDDAVTVYLTSFYGVTSGADFLRYAEENLVTLADEFASDWLANR